MEPDSDKSSEAMKGLYEGSEFAEWASEVVSAGLSPKEKYFIDKYLGDRGAEILEVGCGGGRICLALAQHKYLRLTGVDFSARMIESAKQNQDGLALPAPVRFQEADAARLPFPDQAFDGLLYLANVLCFLARGEDRKKALAEAWRVLRPGGTAIISVLNFRSRKLNPAVLTAITAARAVYNPRSYSGRLLPWLKRGGRPNWKFLFPGEPQVYWYLEEELIGECKEVGLAVVESYRGTGVPGRAERTTGEDAIFLAVKKT